MAELIQLAHPLLQIALLDPQGEALPCRSVANRGDGDDGVGGAAAVGLVGVPQQPGVVAGAEHGHPALSERGFELVFGAAAHLVHLVDEQHAETSHTRRCGLNALAQRTVTRTDVGRLRRVYIAQLRAVARPGQRAENLVSSLG